MGEGNKMDSQGLLLPHFKTEVNAKKLKIGPNSDLKVRRKFNETEEEEEERSFKKMLFVKIFIFFTFLSLPTALPHFI